MEGMDSTNGKLSIFQSIDFAQLQKKYKIKNGDWVVTRIDNPHSFFKFFKPSQTCKDVYEERHLGFSIHKDYILSYPAKISTIIIKSEDECLKELFLKQIHNLA